MTAKSQSTVSAMRTLQSGLSQFIFTVRAMLCVVYATALCLCVCLSQVGVLLKWLNIGIHKQWHMIAQGLQFYDAKNLQNSKGVTPNGGAKCRWGSPSWQISTNNLLSRKRYKIDAYKVDAQFLLKTNRKSYALYRMALFAFSYVQPFQWNSDL